MSSYSVNTSLHFSWKGPRLHCLSAQYVKIANVLCQIIMQCCIFTKEEKKKKSHETRTFFLFTKGDNHFKMFIKRFPFWIGCNLLWQQTPKQQGGEKMDQLQKLIFKDIKVLGSNENEINWNSRRGWDHSRVHWQSFLFLDGRMCPFWAWSRAQALHKMKDHWQRESSRLLALSNA